MFTTVLQKYLNTHIMNNLIFCKSHDFGLIKLFQAYNFQFVLWRVYPMQEMLSHRNLETRKQQQNYGLNQRDARRQLCERLDCATVSKGHVTSGFRSDVTPAMRDVSNGGESCFRMSGTDVKPATAKRGHVICV
jgi:hypothetical protein